METKKVDGSFQKSVERKTEKETWDEEKLLIVFPNRDFKASLESLA